jgi:hypothetical protein
MRSGWRVDEQVSLSTSPWNYFRAFYPTKPVRVAYLLVPILLVIGLAGGSGAYDVAMVAAAIVLLLALWSQRGAYATSTAIHFRGGLLGLRSEELPLVQVDDVVAESIPFFAGLGLRSLGDITVKRGSRYLSFECVRHAKAVAQELLARRDRARGQGGTG